MNYKELNPYVINYALTAMAFDLDSIYADDRMEYQCTLAKFDRLTREIFLPYLEKHGGIRTGEIVEYEGFRFAPLYMEEKQLSAYWKENIDPVLDSLNLSEYYRLIPDGETLTKLADNAKKTFEECCNVMEEELLPFGDPQQDFPELG